MSIPGAASPLFIGAAAGAAAGYQINRSLRFNSNDTAYLNRTPSSASNRKTFTFSCWVKLATLGTERIIFQSGNNWFRFETGDPIYFYWSGSDAIYTDAIFRDPAAWQHLVLAVDTTQSTASNRIKIYVNGAQAAVSGTQPSQNADLDYNNNAIHYIGRQGHNTSNMFDGYLAEVHFIDGQQLANTDFGELDDNNNWNPKEYSGSYGTNGFYLNFANNGSNAGLGTDSSGNSNTWTVNNLTAREEKWSNYLTSTASFTSNQGPDKAFDNSLSGPDVPYNDSGVPMTWTPPGGLAYFSKVEVYVGGISGFTYSLNGASAVSATINAWNTVATGSGTINTLVFDRSSGETHGPHAIRIDNVVLVDGTPSNTDSLIDTPTNYTADTGNNGGNYCVFNAIDRNPAANYSEAPRNGNLDTNPRGDFTGTIPVTSGKWYWEITITSVTTAGQAYIGVLDVEQIQTGSSRGWATSQIAAMRDNGSLYGDGSTGSGVSYTQGDVLGFALDAGTGKLWIAKNNTWINSGNPAGGTGHAFSGLSYSAYTPIASDSNTGQVYSLNAGQRPFAYTPPTNFLSICTTNLPDPTIADGSTAFDAKLYNGNGSNTNTISGLSFGPDLVWLKRRNAEGHHALYDAVRGAYKHVGTSHQLVEKTEPTGRGLSAFNSDGFTIDTSNGDHSGSGNINVNSASYVAWAWDAGTSTVSNTDGSITSNVRANQSAGFSICTYTGNGTANSTVGHGLNAAPSWIIIKNRDQSPRSWMVLHTSAGLTGTTLDGSAEYKMLKLESTNAAADLTNDNIWNPTSTTFKINGAGTGNSVNYSGDDYLALVWAPVEGYSAFGLYTGNGNSNGTFVYTGFRPAFILIKASSISGKSWLIYDKSRDGYNRNNDDLAPDKLNQENDVVGSANSIDILSNGFKPISDNSRLNQSGANYIYAAFAEHPFKTARAR